MSLWEWAQVNDFFLIQQDLFIFFSIQKYLDDKQEKTDFFESYEKDTEQETEIEYTTLTPDLDTVG